MVLGGIGFAIAVIAPVMRSRKSARISDREYFAAARRRAIAHRLAARGGLPRQGNQ